MATPKKTAKKSAKSVSNSKSAAAVVRPKRAQKKGAKKAPAVKKKVPVESEDPLEGVFPPGLSIDTLLSRYVYPEYPQLPAVLEVWKSVATNVSPATVLRLGGRNRVRHPKVRVAELWENCAARGLIPAEWLSSTTREFLGGCACGAAADRFLDNLFHDDNCADKHRPCMASLAAAMASDPSAVLSAEQRLRELCAALVPWGLEPLQKIMWASEEGEFLNVVYEWDFTSDASAPLEKALAAANQALLHSRNVAVIRARKRALRAQDEALLRLRGLVTQRRKPKQRKRYCEEIQSTLFEWLVGAAASWHVAEQHGLKLVATPARKAKLQSEIVPRALVGKQFSALKNPVFALFALFETGVDWVAYQHGCAVLRWQVIEEMVS